jgi:uncharacterized DUF497 family protein
MQFEWDAGKALRNLKKHGIAFEEAESVFDDRFCIEFYDPKHSASEHRFLIVGESNLGRLLIVSFTERGNLARIISVRETTASERKDYGQEDFK